MQRLDADRDGRAPDTDETEVRVVAAHRDVVATHTQ